ncbi:MULTISPECIES: hypothetical protein [unclassified Lactococcus]|uniref:hypothetical protein n=1 Tax=unclassified Lactococcus TaxID=2643510 RepID=UPI0011CA9D51|nr:MULTISPECIES: hypothetical protein [unclassified Lactococcus]MQW23729.1 hypothetical protein [Lactococcus sp. dk101]TXK37476.1 hypothetical protein FVP42_08920 [Lactococcus sp. dk310]TXK48819.1 hypothetical protein FVP43_08895 [Lactococcus sp. dk322]
MDKIIVNFSDGTSKTFHEGQIVIPWKKSGKNVSTAEPYTLWVHPDYELIPSFMEMLVNCDFFYELETPKICYASNSVVKVEVI